MEKRANGTDNETDAAESNDCSGNNSDSEEYVPNEMSKWIEPVEIEGVTLYDIYRKPRRQITDDRRISMVVKSLNHELSCAVCLGILRDTMIVMECLHRFCSQCIQKCLRVGKKECPQCRKHIPSRRSLRPDTNFDAIIATIYPDLDAYEAAEEVMIESFNANLRKTNSESSNNYRVGMQKELQRQRSQSQSRVPVQRGAKRKGQEAAGSASSPTPPSSNSARGRNSSASARKGSGAGAGETSVGRKRARGGGVARAEAGGGGDRDGDGAGKEDTDGDTDGGDGVGGKETHVQEKRAGGRGGKRSSSVPSTQSLLRQLEMDPETRGFVLRRRPGEAAVSRLQREYVRCSGQVKVHHMKQFLGQQLSFPEFHRFQLSVIVRSPPQGVLLDEDLSLSDIYEHIWDKPGSELILHFHVMSDDEADSLYK